MSAADRIYWLHALSPVHVGTGRGEGYIDLPLAREKVTNFPYVPASSVKGVIADRHGATPKAREDTDKVLLKAAFGTAGDEHANSGALVLTDARLVCLPVRSYYGTFAWCTSRLVLRRLLRDLTAAGLTGLPDVPPDGAQAPGPASMTAPPRGTSGDPADGLLAFVPASPASVLVQEKRVYLEDLDLVSRTNDEVGKWAEKLAGWVFPGKDSVAWRDLFRKRFAVLPDDLFNFLCETGTEIQPHVRIEADTKRVARGALWYEESLPAETILAGLVWCDRVPPGLGVKPEAILKTVCTDADADSLQIGGKATVGKGRIRCLFTAGATT